MLCWLPQSTGTLPAGTPPYLREIFARLHASGSSATKELIVAIANKPVTPELSDSAVDGVAKAIDKASESLVERLDPLRPANRSQPEASGGVLKRAMKDVLELPLFRLRGLKSRLRSEVDRQFVNVRIDLLDDLHSSLHLLEDKWLVFASARQMLEDVFNCVYKPQCEVASSRAFAEAASRRMLEVANASATSADGTYKHSVMAPRDRVAAAGHASALRADADVFGAQVDDAFAGGLAQTQPAFMVSPKPPAAPAQSVASAPFVPSFAPPFGYGQQFPFGQPFAHPLYTHMGFTAAGGEVAGGRGRGGTPHGRGSRGGGRGGRGRGGANSSVSFAEPPSTSSPADATGQPGAKKQERDFNRIAAYKRANVQ